jgi:hypothetical protein
MGHVTERLKRQAVTHLIFDQSFLRAKLRERVPVDPLPIRRALCDEIGPTRRTCRWP